jgi:hypothetical protein
LRKGYTNIDLFDLAVMEIMGQLYEQFPERVKLNSIVIGYKVTNYLTDQNIKENGFEDMDIGEHTLNWLRDAGYIWVESVEQCDFYGVTLSPFGLSIIKSKPSSLKDRKAFSEVMMKNIFPAIAKTAVKATISS